MDGLHGLSGPSLRAAAAAAAAGSGAATARTDIDGIATQKVQRGALLMQKVKKITTIKSEAGTNHPILGRRCCGSDAGRRGSLLSVQTENGTESPLAT